MEREAVKLIGDNAIAATNTLNSQLSAVNAVALPDGFNLKSLESLSEERDRYRAVFSTGSIDDFIKYAAEQGGSRVFVDTDVSGNTEMSAEAIFDLGTTETPLHAEHRSVLTLVPTAAYKTVRQINGKLIKQGELADFIEDWPQNIEMLDGDEVLPKSQAINAIRNVTIAAKATSEHREENFNVARSAMEEIEARSNAGRLPGRILFTLTPHAGFEPIVIELRVAVRTGEEKPAFVLRWMRQEEQIDGIGRELVDKLTGGLEQEHHKVLCGSYKV